MIYCVCNNKKLEVAKGGTAKLRNIKKIRLMRGYTQRYLAYKTGVSQQAVVKWESGISAPKFPRLKLIAQALECDVSDLLDD